MPRIKFVHSRKQYKSIDANIARKYNRSYNEQLYHDTNGISTKRQITRNIR